MVFIPGPNDPFFSIMSPPPDETPAQATARLKRELDAQKTSDEIDEQLKRWERSEQKKRKGIVRLLLLGQSESGKSTTLKNFRMRYAQAEWDRERNGWRAVVQLNVVHCITTILRVVEEELNDDAPTDSEEESIIEHDVAGSDSVGLTDRHQLLMIRLTPLFRVEAELKRRLGSGSEEVRPSSTSQLATPFDEPEELDHSRRRMSELAVRSWKVLEHSQDSNVSSSLSSVDDATRIIAECKDDMKALCHDRAVELALKRRRLQLPDSMGFFLDNLDRIAVLDYAVTDDDIVRARLRTVGIQEYRLFFERSPWDNPRTNKKSGWEWRIFDVGGCRTMRAAWLPYFENVNVIIFLSPVSVFDQRLAEDPSVNRFEDSVILWEALCASPLLARTQLIVFLNKCDLLKKKLKRGVRFSQFIPSYGDRPNEATHIVKYINRRFKHTQKELSPLPRGVYIYPTTVTNTTGTAIILESVRDGVLRENLAATQLI